MRKVQELGDIIYFSGPDYEEDTPKWREDGELPSCVDPDRMGEFHCRCGRHYVKIEVSTDPIDNEARVARTVRNIVPAKS